VEAYRTEEEQLEAIKEWWKRNGTSIVLALTVGIAAVLGWRLWQNHQASQRAAAANQFQELLQTLQNKDAGKRLSSIQYIADKMQKDFPDSVYSVFATLTLAKEQLQTKDKGSKALDSLQWALTHANGQNMKTLVTQRLARAQFGTGKADEALKTLDSVKDPGAYTALYKELEGDIYRQQGKPDQARKAYEAARKASGDQPDPLLKLKMQDMAIPEAN